MTNTGSDGSGVPEWGGGQRGSNEQGLFLVASCLQARRVGPIAYVKPVQVRVLRAVLGACGGG